jgi:hypothetical protein
MDNGSEHCVRQLVELLACFGYDPALTLARDNWYSSGICDDVGGHRHGVLHSVEDINRGIVRRVI